jgi:membrane fusion protein, copper/silver efflux system
MTRPLQICLAFSLALVSFSAGAWYTSRRQSSPTAGTQRRVLYYHDPMHPSYKSDRPGTAPDCGMDLEPVFADEVPAPSGTPGTVRISAEKQQLIGIRTAEVQHGGGRHTFRTSGRVTVDETRVYRLTSTVDGWVLKTFPLAAGNRVTRGQTLLTFYSRDFLGAEQAYFYALDSLDRMSQGGKLPDQQKATTLAQIQQAKDSLLAMGMGEQQIADLAATRKLTQEVLMTAPVDSTILARNVSPGLRFDRGIEFFRVADLSRVWILADLYESDAASLQPGMNANVIWQGRGFTARVADASAQFDGASRTLRLRLEAANPNYLLRPDMFVDVELPVRLPGGLTVPAEAVVDSGRKTLVYVERAPGEFEPRVVETGWRSGDIVAIARGVEAGERVVVGGNFLLDSESRLRLAAAGAPASESDKDPVCGMTVTSAKHSLTRDGTTYRFCSEKCKRDFESAHEKYSKRGAS